MAGVYYRHEEQVTFAPAASAETPPPLYQALTINYSSSTTDKATMITCYLRYIIDPYKQKEFELYGKMWIPLVQKFGGTHHGYFLPSEGVSNVALAMFSFPTLALYEEYRNKSMQDAACQAAFKYAEDTRCIVSYERSFFRPVFE